MRDTIWGEPIKQAYDAYHEFQNRKRYGGMRDCKVELSEYGSQKTSFKTVNGMEACATIDITVNNNTAWELCSFKTVNGMEACATMTINNQTISSAIYAIVSKP